jgi:uncharacterized protein with HEPN domain
MSEIDWELIRVKLKQIRWAVRTIRQRFRHVPDVEFFRTRRGRERLDGICMLLEAVGETFKQIDKLSNKTFLSRYPEIDWKRIINLRNIIAHVYFDVNEVLVFNNCRDHLPPLLVTVKRMIEDLKPTADNERCQP